MENYKVLVSSESKSKEVQDLLFELGGDFCFGGKLHCNTHLGLVTINKNGLMANIELEGFDYKEITINQLRDVVALKRNSIDDAIFKDTFGDIWYVDSTNSYWMFENGIWREAEEPLFKLEQIKKFADKDGEVKMKEKEYIAKVSGDWRLVESHELVSGRIEVPEGAEIFLLDASCGKDVLYFVKHDGDVFHEYYISGTDIQNNTWIKGTIKELHKCMGKVLWQRNLTKTDTSTQEKLKSINKEREVKEKEYLDEKYELRSVKQTSGDNHVPSGWIEVPEGAEILYFDKRYEPSNHFFKTVNGKSYYKYLKNGSKWMEYSDNGLNNFKESIDNFHIMWQRNTETTNTSIQDKLKFIEKWLNGEKIQYILGIESDKIQSEKTKWHNFTEGAMQYIKRSDIKFREAPKYVTINGIEFKNVKSLLKHVKNNFDLDDEE